MPHHALFVLDMDPRALCMSGKLSDNQAMSPALCMSIWDGRILSYLIVVGTMARKSHFNHYASAGPFLQKETLAHRRTSEGHCVGGCKAHSRYLRLNTVFSVPGTSLKFPEERNGSPSLGYPPESTA